MLPVIKNEYDRVVDAFNVEKKSFGKRRDSINSVTFSSINWSSAYLDFYPYSSATNQLKPATIYKEEKPASIKNCYLEGELVFACHSENENWGTVFIDYGINSKKWMLFSENDDEEMVLRQLKIACFENNKYVKVVSYLNDEDAEEETLTIDLFEYGSDNQISKIKRCGFFEEATNLLHVREMNFLYNGNKVQIYEKDKQGKEQLIYNGKIH
uniref:hypothetical protein n=1 Tax=Pedobacter schmidteae TaxID=2201271 RepID=UPI000EAC7056|nr:hypothetical protein [Pedobacter schmidteae]